MFTCRHWGGAVGQNVLFLDARNYYTVVDRTLNEWSPWQLKNLTAIVWLYRGETDKYKKLLNEYREALGSADFAKAAAELDQQITAARESSKKAQEGASRRDRKKVAAQFDDKIAELEAKRLVAREAEWLYSKFGENGEYRDIPGLCKVATLKEIAEKNYSLTPGAYVGVAETKDDGVNFAQRMGEIHRELLKLQEESNTLMATISKNLKEMGL
ncbi:MAG: N-6 DNA methylase [Myxococcaceae bacterium]|nr:N-6 DNA methylase [Myxococcaceae bacterium]